MKTSPNRRAVLALRLRVPLLALVAGLSLMLPARAVANTCYWIGTSSANNNWQTIANWWPNVIPANGDDLVFWDTNGVKNSANLTGNAATMTNYNSITFTNGGFTILCNTDNRWLTFPTTGGLITNLPGFSGNNLIQARIINNGPLTIANANPTSTLTLDPNISQYTSVCEINAMGNSLTFDGLGKIVLGSATSGRGAISNALNLTKTGTGSLQLFGTNNSWSGTCSVLSGSLDLNNRSSIQGGISINDDCTFGANVNFADFTLTVESLAFGTSASSYTTNNFVLNAYGNFGRDVMFVTNLNVKGTVYVKITGGGFVPGPVTLLRYQNLTGALNFVLNNPPAGVTGELLPDPVAKTVTFNVLSVPELKWTAYDAVNGVVKNTWDIGVTPNWQNISDGPAVYQDGLSVHFDDTASDSVVVLSTNMAPYSVEVNTAGTYTFSNKSLNGPSTSLTKNGPGTLQLAAANTYGGFTCISNGTLKQMVAGGIGGNSAVTNYGVLDLNGFNLSVASLSGTGIVINSGATPGTTNVFTVGGNSSLTRSLSEGPGILQLVKTGAGTLTLGGTNTYSGGTIINGAGPIQLTGNNSLGSGRIVLSGTGSGLSADLTPRTVTNGLDIGTSVVFGMPSTAPMTFSGDSQFRSGGDHSLTFNSDVTFAFPAFSSSISNNGISDIFAPGTWTLKNMSCVWSNAGNLEQHSGKVVLDGTRVDMPVKGWRVRCDNDNETATLSLLNGASITLYDDGVNLRVGVPDIASHSASNVLNVSSSEIHVFGGSGGQILLSARGQRAILNASGGSLLECRGISYSYDSYEGINEVNFDNATLRPTRKDKATAHFWDPNYLMVSQVTIKSGGLTVDTTTNGYSITIAENLHGDGGITKMGAGVLTLNGYNDYHGPTHVVAGGLSLGTDYSGSGAVTVEGGAALTVVDTTYTTYVSTLSVSSLALNGAGDQPAQVNLTWNPGRSPTTPLIQVNQSGGLTANGTGNVVVNISTTDSQPLPLGTYKLIGYSGNLGGSIKSFAVGSLPPGMYAVLLNSGTSIDLRVTAQPIQTFISQPYRDGSGNLVLMGTNLTGEAGGAYSVLSSTNVAAPLSSWRTDMNGTFDVGGVFSNAIPINLSEPRRFFIISTPQF